SGLRDLCHGLCTKTTKSSAVTIGEKEMTGPLLSYASCWKTPSRRQQIRTKVTQKSGREKENEKPGKQRKISGEKDNTTSSYCNSSNGDHK
ncbi:hypothetical protein CSUI_011067, partial [Cystoisospora suis]